MAWFIIQCERKTWTKYIVQAEDEHSAMAEADSWKYLGYVDGDDTEASVLAGPFVRISEAYADIHSYVDG